jgi:hypothetical protein
MSDGQPGAPADGPLLATSRTLLLGLREGDAEAWDRFVRTYGVAMRRWRRALPDPRAAGL